MSFIHGCCLLYCRTDAQVCSIYKECGGRDPEQGGTVSAGADEIDQRHRGAERGGEMEIADMNNIGCNEEHRKIVSAPLCR